MPGRFEALGRWYGGCVRRGGFVYPTSVVALAATCHEVLAVEPVEAEIDPVLRAQGSAHLDQVRAANPAVHDGPLLAADSVAGGVVRARRCGYFSMLATCDAIRAEYAGSPGDAGSATLPASAVPASLPLRRRAHEVAAGDPLVSGRGRAAALGVTVVLTLPAALAAPAQGRSTADRVFVIGRRSGRVATDSGLWHLVPSGMLEDAGRHSLAATVADELAEELDIHLDVDEVAARAVVLGLAHDLLRLRPDLCVRLDLRAGEAPAGAVTAGVAEFDRTELVEISAAGLADFWRRRPPEQLTPAAAGAVALLEDALDVR